MNSDVNSYGASSYGTPSQGTPSSGIRRGPVMPYIPALDGLRALAVLVVIVYHANKKWLGGGFLGVEVFFVISGYLITLLLVAERERTDTVTLRDFWWRRARRLLPALWTMMVLLVVWCTLFDRQRLGMLRGDVIAGFTYVSNWFQVWTGSSYTSSFAFAPLRHLWSLAVEEQYYIIWPVVMYLVLRRLNRRSFPVVGMWFVGIAIAIAVVSALMFVPGPIDTFATTPDQYMSIFGRQVLRVDFLYLGTLTRATGLLLGSALAMMWQPWSLKRGRAASTSGTIDIVGLLAVVGLGFMVWRFRDVVQVTDSGTEAYALLYRGGLLLVGLASAVAIAAVTHPRSEFGRWVIGNPLFVWIGVRSYGLYLYHWPIFQMYRKTAGNSLTPFEFAWLMAITLVVTEVSYRFIEMPIRKGRGSELLSRLTGTASSHRPNDRQTVVLASLAALALPAFAVVSLATAKVVPDDITQSFKDNEGSVTNLGSTTTSVPVGTTVPSQTTQPVKRIDILAVGDSVMLGAASQLKARGVTVDAAKNRQFIESLQLFNYLKATGELGDYVVVHLGTNNGTTPTNIDRVMAPLVGVRQVVFLTLHVPGEPWEEKTNELITALPSRYPNVKVLDWKTLSTDAEGIFAKDSTHLSKKGAEFYADQIMAALGR